MVAWAILLLREKFARCVHIIGEFSHADWVVGRADTKELCKKKGKKSLLVWKLSNLIVWLWLTIDKCHFIATNIVIAQFLCAKRFNQKGNAHFSIVQCIVPFAIIQIPIEQFFNGFSWQCDNIRSNGVFSALGWLIIAPVIAYPCDDIVKKRFLPIPNKPNCPTVDHFHALSNLRMWRVSAWEIHHWTRI